MTAVLVMIIVLVAPALSAVLLLVADMANRTALGRMIAAVVMLVAGCVALYAGWSVEPSTVWDGLATGGGRATAAGLVLALSAASVAVSSGRRPGTAAALIAFAAGGAIVALSATGLVTMLIGIEIAAVCAYGLVALAGDGRADEAAMKYFMQGSVATGFFVLGLAIVIGLVAPDGKLATILAAAGSFPSSVLMLAAVGLVSALSFKAGAAPFHSWAPDAYETAPPHGSAFMAGPLKLGMVATLASIVTVFGSAVAQDGPLGPRLVVVLGGLAILSVAIGSTVALRTRSYARLLGYAGVAQVGYALIALASTNPSGALLFVSTYALATCAAFIAAVAFRSLRPEWDGTVEGLAGIGRTSPVLGGAVTLALVSLSGIPPLLGFWGKFQAFGSAIAVSAGYFAQGQATMGWWLAGLAAVGVTGSIVSLGYYGAIVRSIYSEAGENAIASEPSKTARLPIALVVVLAFVLLAAGVAPLFGNLSQLVTGFLLTLS